MATTAQMEAIADIILEEFDSDPGLFRSSLKRLRLEAELAALESAARNIQASQDADNVAFSADMVANAEARAVKQSEIDGL